MQKICTNTIQLLVCDLLTELKTCAFSAPANDQLVHCFSHKTLHTAVSQSLKLFSPQFLMSRLYSQAGGFTLNSGQALKTCKEQKKARISFLTPLKPYTSLVVVWFVWLSSAHSSLSPSPLEKHTHNSHESIYLRPCLGIFVFTFEIYSFPSPSLFLPQVFTVTSQNKQYSTVIKYQRFSLFTLTSHTARCCSDV